MCAGRLNRDSAANFDNRGGSLQTDGMPHALLYVVFVAALPPLPRRRGIAARRWLVLGLATFCLVGLATLGWRRRASELDRSEAELRGALPRPVVEGKFAASSSCRSCHPRQYASWHASFHRQMTQAARPDTVLGPFDGSSVEFEGQSHRMVRRGDELWVESSPTGSADPSTTGTDSPADPRQARRVVMTTGAHHMQLYWAAGDKGNLLDELPLVYLRDDEERYSRWAPLEASYLSPTPPELGFDTHWNTSCIFCHSTGGNPRRDRRTGATDTRVAELGIACEACHGPAEKHVELQRKLPTDGVDPIVNPARLSPAHSAQVCGYCHAVASFVGDQLIEDYFVSGVSFRPGDDLSQSRVTLLPSKLSDEQLEGIRQINPIFDGSFWPDGMVRVAGREYNGLLESTCHQQGGMICLSCHSMHQSQPNDQLAEAMEGNQACYQCHESYRADVASHTHHAQSSSGSLCYNCHMPHTTYGLFKAIRSHQISSPSAAVSLATGRPNACNLCHLDQTLAWTAERLADWYDQPLPQFDDRQQTISAALLWLFEGNSIQRVLLAWMAGWRPATEASEGQWLVPHLAQLLNDPSPAIRLVAYRSIRSLAPELVDDYDFVAPESDRAISQRRIFDWWRQLPEGQKPKAAGRLLLDADGGLLTEKIEQLLRERDPEQVQVRE